MKFNVTVLPFKSESERKLRANDREYNRSFNYAVSICVVVACLPFSLIFTTLNLETLKLKMSLKNMPPPTSKSYSKKNSRLG